MKWLKANKGWLIVLATLGVTGLVLYWIVSLFKSKSQSGGSSGLGTPATGLATWLPFLSPGTAVVASGSNSLGQKFGSWLGSIFPSLKGPAGGGGTFTADNVPAPTTTDPALQGPSYGGPSLDVYNQPSAPANYIDN